MRVFVTQFVSHLLTGLCLKDILRVGTCFSGPCRCGELSTRVFVESALIIQAGPPDKKIEAVVGENSRWSLQRCGRQQGFNARMVFLVGPYAFFWPYRSPRRFRPLFGSFLLMIFQANRTRGRAGNVINIVCTDGQCL